MNLQAVKEKKGDTFYKLKDELKSMADVDLTDTNGELRSTFDLIVDLSKNWDKLSEMQQSSLLQGIAGKQQANYSSYVQKCAQDTTLKPVNPKALQPQ